MATEDFYLNYNSPRRHQDIRRYDDRRFDDRDRYNNKGGNDPRFDDRMREPQYDERKMRDARYDDRRGPPPDDRYNRQDRRDDYDERMNNRGGGGGYKSQRDDYNYSKSRNEYFESRNDHYDTRTKSRNYSPSPERNAKKGAATKSQAPKPDRKEVDYLLDVFRKACLKRGTAGIKGFGRQFRQYDDNRDKKLVMYEFRNGVRDYGLTSSEISDSGLSTLFAYFDRDDNGSISFDEFLLAIRPPMNDARKKLIARAFDKLDATGDGVITVEDLIDPENGYDVKKHPKFLNGELSERKILLMFLENFEAPRSKDGKVTREEFFDYYAGVSASIDKDVYFDLMMRQSWRLDKPPSYVGRKAQKFEF